MIDEFEKVFNEKIDALEKNGLYSVADNVKKNRPIAIEFFHAAISEVNKHLEKVPCSCHFFKNQVCDFCQEIVLYLRKPLHDNKSYQEKY